MKKQREESRKSLVNTGLKLKVESHLHSYTKDFKDLIYKLNNENIKFKSELLLNDN